jgi:hypothetical protein
MVDVAFVIHASRQGNQKSKLVTCVNKIRFFIKLVTRHVLMGMSLTQVFVVSEGIITDARRIDM